MKRDPERNFPWNLPIQAETTQLESRVMTNRRITLLDIWLSRPWYGFAAAWAGLAFLRMAVYQGPVLLVIIAIAFGFACFAFLIHTLAHIARHGKQPAEDQQQADFQKIGKPIFAAGWYGSIGACIAATIVVIECNDPFAKEAIERVVKDHSVLFWSVVAAGFVIGAGDHVWKMARMSNDNERPPNTDRPEDMD